MTGLSGFVLMSATGARSSVMPAARELDRPGRARRARSARRRRPRRARAGRAPSFRVEASSRVTSPPSSSIHDDRLGRHADGRHEAPAAGRCHATLRAKSTTPPRPSSSSRRSQSGADVPANPGRMQARREPFERVAHPLTADGAGREPERDLAAARSGRRRRRESQSASRPPSGRPSRCSGSCRRSTRARP